MRRNLTKLKTNYSSELIGKNWLKINSGDYGDVALPSDTDCLSVRSDTSIVPEKMDEQSNAKSNSRVRYKNIRMRGNSKVTLSLDLNGSDLAGTEWAEGKVLELCLGKKTQINSAQGATVSLSDPNASKAGLILTTAGALNGFAGNYVSVKFVLGGSSGTASLDATSSPEFIVTYFNDSTVEDVVTALDGNANLVCAADSIGDDETDLFKDLLAACALANGSKVYLAGGSEAGYQYDNSEAPSKDATLTHNREKVGYTVTGLIFDKLTVEVNEKAPSVKAEGQGRYALAVGYTTVSQAVSNTNKAYVADYKQFAQVDEDAPQLVDVIDNDGVTKKASALEIIGSGSDGTGPYVLLSGNITCDSGDYLAFHEPSNFNPKINPLNGLGGSLKIDNESYPDVRNIKVEVDNNHEVFDNLALQKTISGFSASKYQNLKISATVLVRKDRMGIIRKLTGPETVEVPVEIKIGTNSGKQMTVFCRFVQLKAPNLSEKAEAVQEVTLEGEVVLNPEADNVPGIVIVTH